MNYRYIFLLALLLPCQVVCVETFVQKMQRLASSLTGEQPKFFYMVWFHAGTRYSDQNSTVVRSASKVLVCPGENKVLIASIYGNRFDKVGSNITIYANNGISND